MTNEEKARDIAEYLNKPNGSDCLVQCHQAAMAMAVWKDEQFAKIGYTKEQLISMGFGFTLNGNIVTPKEEEETSKKYIEYQKQQMVEKAFDAMREIYETYGYIPENCKEEFEQIIRRNHE